jgi:hydrogenase/urease accessory protein HupE
MRRSLQILGAAAALTAGFAHAHPGVHHLNGVGHSVAGSDEWLTIAAVGVWALLQAGLAVGLYLKRRRKGS